MSLLVGGGLFLKDMERAEVFDSLLASGFTVNICSLTYWSSPCV